MVDSKRYSHTILSVHLQCSPNGLFEAGLSLKFFHWGKEITGGIIDVAFCTTILRFGFGFHFSYTFTQSYNSVNCSLRALAVIKGLVVARWNLRQYCSISFWFSTRISPGRLSLAEPTNREIMVARPNDQLTSFWREKVLCNYSDGISLAGKTGGIIIHI